MSSLALHALASLAFGFFAVGQASIYLPPHNARRLIAGGLIAALLFFLYAFTPEVRAIQFAFVVGGCIIACVTVCLVFDGGHYDEVYTGLIQSTMSILCVYLAERAVLAFGDPTPIAAVPPGANAHFVANPGMLFALVALNAVWVASMFVASRTALRLNPYPESVYRVCCFFQAGALIVLLFVVFGGEAAIAAVLPAPFVVPALAAAIVALGTVVPLTGCGYTNRLVIEQARSRIIERNVDAMRDHVESLADSIAEMRAFRHDQRHLTATVTALLDAGEIEKARELLQRTQDEIDQAALAGFCSDPIMNAILVDTLKRCRRCGVRFAASVRMPEPRAVADTHLISLVKNALDNAVNSCELLPNAEERAIDFSVTVERGLFAMRCENPIGEPDPSGGRFAAARRRDDGREHGIGLESMRRVVRRYGGELSIEREGGRFLVSAILENRAPDPEA